MKLVGIGLCSLLFSFAGNALANHVDAKQDTLLGLRVSSKGITYYVYSGGCTSKSDFQVNILESYPPQLQLVRTRPDYCKVLVPDGEEIFFSWEEVGLQKGTPFKVLNSLKKFVVPG